MEGASNVTPPWVAAVALVSPWSPADLGRLLDVLALLVNQTAPIRQDHQIC
jgi:hypothetical protein